MSDTLLGRRNCTVHLPETNAVSRKPPSSSCTFPRSRLKVWHFLVYSSPLQGYVTVKANRLTDIQILKHAQDPKHLCSLLSTLRNTPIYTKQQTHLDTLACLRFLTIPESSLGLGRTLWGISDFSLQLMTSLPNRGAFPAQLVFSDFRWSTVKQCIESISISSLLLPRASCPVSVSLSSLYVPLPVPGSCILLLVFFYSLLHQHSANKLEEVASSSSSQPT